MNIEQKTINLTKLFFLVVLILLPTIIFAQEKKEEEKKIKPEIYGFIKNDMFWDSRQTVAAREGHFLLFPSPVANDPNGNDINAVPNFNFLALQSRFGIQISGTEALKAKVSGKIEADFFAQANDNINLLRLRHAYMKLNWKTTELMFGQYWIPMFITDCFPGTISFNTGTPFQPFGRSPQIRLTKKISAFKFVAIANSQRDYASRGISGVTGSYLRNSAVPELSGQLHLNLKNADESNLFLFGTGASYKSIVPQIETSKGYATNESVSGFNAIVFSKIKISAVTLKMEGVYGQNMPDVLSLGGITVTSLDTATGFQTYATINAMSAWADLSVKIKKVELGIFGGYSQNLGTEKDVFGDIYGLGTSIESMYRVSPRIALKCNKVKFALEGEYTAANYGTPNNRAIPENLTQADNLRLLFATYYSF